MSRLVYSTGPEGGRSAGEGRCPHCRLRPCGCPAAPLRAPADHSIRVRTERSGRRGKTVTVAGPFCLSRDDAVGVLKALKRACGCGGTLKLEPATGQTMEIQGDQVDRVVEQLARQGFSVTRG